MISRSFWLVIIGLLVTGVLSVLAHEEMARSTTLSVVFRTSTPNPAPDRFGITLSEDSSARPILGGLTYKQTRPVTIAVLLDSTNFLPVSGRGLNSYAETIKSAAKKALSKNSRLPFALYTSYQGLNVVRDAVDEKGLSMQALPELSSRDIENAISTYSRPMTIKQKLVTIHLKRLMVEKLAEVESIAQHFSAVPGHKALVWFCGQGFVFPPQEGIVITRSTPR